MKISVIIPTFNRKESLALTLQALSRQSFKDFETIIVDDGSTDGTREFITRFAEATARRENLTSPLRVKYIRQGQRGPASARNLGIKEAEGEIIFFTGDDIIATRNLLEEHSKAHQEGGENLVVLGYVKTWPEIKMTPFRRYLANYHFAYHKIKNGTDPLRQGYSEASVDWAYFYTSNISLKKSFLEKVGGFDEDFRWAAYEDTELAYRLHQQGMKMILNKKALAYHNHLMNFWSYRQTMERKGESAVLLARKVPTLARKASFGQSKNILKRFLKKLIFNDFILSILSAGVCFLDRLSITLPSFVYIKFLDYYRIKGIKKAHHLL